MKLKNIICLFVLSFAFVSPTFSQKKIDGKVIKEVKEWNIEGKKRNLDHLSKYDSKGNKVEEIEYDSDGKQKSRSTYEYNSNGKCVKEIEYDEDNKVEKTVVTEYFDNGKKKCQNVYLPNGKLKYKKEFEYITE